MAQVYPQSRLCWPFRTHSQSCISPCPHWRVFCHTTNLVSESESEDEGNAKNLISVMCGEEYTLVDIEDDYLLLEGNQKRGWCSLRYCEIIWMDSFKDKVRFERELNAELLPIAPNRSVQPPFGSVQRRFAHQSHHDADAADERSERPVACGMPNRSE